MTTIANTITFCGRKFYESPPPLEMLADGYEQVKGLLTEGDTIESCQRKFMTGLNGSSGKIEVLLARCCDGRQFFAIVEEDCDGVCRAYCKLR